MRRGCVLGNWGGWGMSNYGAFLEQKRRLADPAGIEPGECHPD